MQRTPAVELGATRPSAISSFRPDIQGLRAVAVGAVLLYHANWSLFSGGFVGVDVFFVISGFLITGILLREAQKTGRIRLADFYAKRARRILPAATVVLLATLILTVMFLPQIRWESIGIEALASAAYLVNWVLAAGTDYLNADVAESPLQHFWTLAVEEQFYIVWPLILVALLAVLRRTAAKGNTADAAGRAMRAARVGVLAILVPSLLFSIYYTGAAPENAYFVTTTRLWELAIGAAIAVFAAQAARVPDWLGYALGWIGSAAIAASALLYSGATQFPGYAALLPTLGAAAVIVGGMNGRAERGVGRLLSLKPMRWVGDISYSLYLWHWPLIVIGTYLMDGELRVRYGLLIVAFAVLPSWLSYKFIENPFRNWQRLKHSVKRSLLAGVGLMVATAVVASSVYFAPRTMNPEYSAQEGEPIGAEALTDDFANDDLESFTDAGKPVDYVEGGFTPSAINARDDNTVVYELGCNRSSQSSVPKIEGCIFGDPNGEVSIVLIGDSHAANWASPFIALAEEHGWRLRITTKAGCGFSSVAQAHRDGYEDTSCTKWNDTSFDQIQEEKPDLVVTANSDGRVAWQSDLSREEGQLLFVDGLRDNLERLNAADIPTLVMNTTPRMSSDIPECISANLGALTECATPREEAFGDGSVFVDYAVDGLSSTGTIDMGNWICPDAEACAPVVGHVVVWRDTHHFTDTYARTLAEPLEAQLRQLELTNSVLFP
ncbi:acyltransferase family protein [uncultured Agrococcus sp.]|uniref:acyltransferase family protein n=1 Tax=uncultured Agrococcus sp. TaxID=382258 RepID=UPI0025FED743|nr:acyltransferase family protein [uncultured Agrococcus sp.]